MIPDPGAGASAHWRLFANPHLEGRPYGDPEREILSLERHAAAREEIRSWPGYVPTPLHPLRRLARELGLTSVWYKDEGPRFGLGSFKALGGPYGTVRLLGREISERTADPRPPSLEQLKTHHEKRLSRTTVTCASTGNHGRSLAWAAGLLGCRCVIFVPGGMSSGRADAMGSYGAEVVRVDGGYDEALGFARATAETEGWYVISDKSEGRATEQVGRDMMQGCTVLIAEVLEQLAADSIPTHVFVPAGVGGLAAAVTAHLWEVLGERRPTMVVVESGRADCLLQSARAGHPVRLEGPLDTMMLGLACREPSPLAWSILRPGAHFFLAISDEAAVEAMRRLAAAGGDDPSIAVGESGAASTAALLRAASDSEARELLGLDSGSVAVVVATEGATDPIIYERIVGHPPHPR
jgi:diaminopropionate ammonia-lyase